MKKIFNSFAISIALTLIAMFCVVIGLSLKDGRNKPERPPQEIIEKAFRLYQAKVRIPNDVLIGIPGKDSTQAYMFQFDEPVNGLKYVGKFELEHDK